MTSKQMKYRHQFTLNGSRPFTYKVSQLSNPYRVVLEVPKSAALLPQMRPFKQAPYTSVEVEKVPKKKNVVRVILHFPKKPPSMTHRLIHHRVVLDFDWTLSSREVVSKSLKGKVIVLDPGHGGKDPGAVGHRKRYEKKYTLDLGYRIKGLLEARGARVILSRKGDTHVSLSKRVSLANRARADAFVSLHINSYYHKRANGTETYYYKPKDKLLAKYIQREMVNVLKRKNLGIKRTRLYVLNHTKMPAALIEPLFLTNKEESYLVTQPHYRQKVSMAVVRGLEAYFSR